MSVTNENKQRDVRQAFNKCSKTFQKLANEFNKYQKNAIITIERKENEKLVKRFNRLEKILSDFAEDLEKLREITESPNYQ